MKWNLHVAVPLAVLALVSTPCSTTRRYGDARLVRHHSIFESTQTIQFPSMRMDEPGTRTFRVRKLPYSHYPGWMRLQISRFGHGWPPGAPVPKFSVVLRDLAGREYVSRTVSADEKGPVQFGRDGRTLVQLFTAEEFKSLPALKDYDLTITVLTGKTPKRITGTATSGF